MIIFNNQILNTRWFYNSSLSKKEIINEYLRPWKLITFSLGMMFLFYGALFFNYPDWDIGVSIIMGSLTYLLSPLSISFFIKSIKYKEKNWFLVVLLCIVTELFVVDWSYMAWHTLMKNETIREGNFITSSFMYIAMGFFWLYKGSLKELLYDIKNHIIIEKK